MDPMYWGIIGFLFVLSLMAMGIHVGLALGVTGFLGMIVMTGRIQLALGVDPETDIFILVVLPFVPEWAPENTSTLPAISLE